MRDQRTSPARLSRYCFLLAACCLLSCKKEKLNVDYDGHGLIGEPSRLSDIRLIDLTGYDQVIANGDSLTNFVAPIDPIDPDYPYDYYKFPGTAYFPADGRFGNSWWGLSNFDGKTGSIWQMPGELFREDGTADLELQNLYYSGEVLNSLRFSVEKNNAGPTDYYLLPSQWPYVPVSRNTGEPVKPGYFKIRIVNLSMTVGSFGNLNGPLENLAGPITLAYADGTPVSPQTSKVAQTSQPENPAVSDYVELPYGTYQFKVLTADGRQIPAVSGDPFFRRIDPPTSSIPRSIFDSSDIPYVPIQTYQPGGIYTLVVTPFPFDYFTNEVGSVETFYQNAFKIVEDTKVEVNTAYARFQGVNALPGNAVTFRLNGKPLAGNAAYGEATNYEIQAAGEYHLEALGQDGAVLAGLDYTLRASQNYTVWLYPATDGSPQLAMEVNDLSGTLFLGGSQEDASFDRIHENMPFSKRFLNLSPDIPYLSLTTDNGQPIISNLTDNKAIYNLQPGRVPSASPYAVWSFNNKDYQLMAFRSGPNVIPGSWAVDIPVLHSQDFIARKALYERAGRDLPAQEPGIYTVALIGRTGSDIPAAYKAKMIIIKHTK